MERIRIITYNIETTNRFDQEFKKLDRYTQRMIKSWIEKFLIGCTDSRQHRKGLISNRSGQWRYQIGDYRLICKIREKKTIILALCVGHRQEIYE